LKVDAITTVEDTRNWITMLSARFLEKMPEEEDVWILVVKKARGYVRECLENEGDLHLLEGMAGTVVRKGKAKELAVDY
jgi:hypothetical protein